MPELLSEIQTYNLDQVSILGRALYISGWAKDFSPALFYGKESLAFLCSKECRPDVAACFDDPAAADWGFALTSLLPYGTIDFSQITLCLREGVSLSNPGHSSNPVENWPAMGMIQGFIDRVKSNRGSLIEIGSRARSGNCYRGFFPADIDYVGLDITEGPNVDVVGDAHEMSSFLDRRFDYAFSISVFEHLLMPWKVAIEMAKILNPGGIAYIQSHSLFPLHDEPWDFWRFSRDGWKGIFNRHTGFEVIDAQYRYPAYTVPKYIDEPGREDVSRYINYLVSACLVRKVGDPLVEWDAKVADVYDLNYTHR